MHDDDTGTSQHTDVADVYQDKPDVLGMQCRMIMFGESQHHTASITQHPSHSIHHTASITQHPPHSIHHTASITQHPSHCIHHTASNRLCTKENINLNRGFNIFTFTSLETKLMMCYVCAYTSHSPPGLDLRTGTTECSEFKSGRNIRQVDCAYDCKVRATSLVVLL